MNCSGVQNFKNQGGSWYCGVCISSSEVNSGMLTECGLYYLPPQLSLGLMFSCGGHLGEGIEEELKAWAGIGLVSRIECEDYFGARAGRRAEGQLWRPRDRGCADGLRGRTLHHW